MRHLGVVGLGATGANVVRQLRGVDDLRVHGHDIDQRRQAEIVEAVGGNLQANNGDLADVGVVVLATPPRGHAEQAAAFLRLGVNVVSMSDHPGDVDDLLALNEQASAAGLSIVVGAGFAPGMSCLLARLGGDALDVVEEVAVAKAGTAGPACARQHHWALHSDGKDWIDHQWVVRRGGSGRDLAWFPGSIGARDCYRGALPSPTLLQRYYPDAQRISARVSATRRDRLTSRLPMLRPPHRDGGPGAIRVEVRGRLDGAYETRTYGVMDHPSVAAGTVAAVAGLGVLDGSIGAGAAGLAEISDPSAFLLELHHRGVKAAQFGGTASQ